jgi:hypothetical protein
MKMKSLIAALLVCAAPAAFAQGAAPAAAPAAKPIPQTPEAWLARMTDMTQNMSAYKDPKVFVPWLNAVTEPGFYTTMGLNMMDPINWVNFMNSMTQPGAYTNMAQFADPNVYMKWLAAGMDPNFYTAVLTQLSDPGKLMRWAMSPMDPKVMQMAMNTLNPNMYMKWMMSPLDPRSMQLMMAPVNPNLYMGWMGASMNPGSYGDMWKGFMNPATYSMPAMPTFAMPAMPAAPAGAAPNFNFFDPNAWTQMFQIPGVTAPAAAPAAPAK